MIKTVQGIDDFGMLREVIQRHYRRLKEEGKKLPQLLLVDGGKGQAGVCFRVLEELGLHQDIFVAGIAKEFEQVFVPHKNSPLNIPIDSPGMKLLQQIRDEAHRFAHSYHRRKRDRKIKESRIEKIPGVGEYTKRVLLSHFKSLKEVEKATLEELMSIPGIGERKPGL